MSKPRTKKPLSEVEIVAMAMFYRDDPGLYLDGDAYWKAASSGFRNAYREHARAFLRALRNGR